MIPPIIILTWLFQTLVAFGAAGLAPCYTALLFRSISSGQRWRT